MPIDGYIWICPVCGHTLIAKEPSREMSNLCSSWCNLSKVLSKSK